MKLKNFTRQETNHDPRNDPKEIQSRPDGTRHRRRLGVPSPHGGCDGAVDKLINSGVLEEVLDEVINGGLEDGYGDPYDTYDPYDDGYGDYDDSWDDFPF